ncbi:MAG: adenosylhomocysteinase, partial [Streptosporangiaceae bacterium]
MSARGGSQQAGVGGGFGSDIADPGLADGGLARIAWAERAMPVLGLLREECLSKQPFAGRSIAACLHVTAETAVLVGV